jgi:hypothetical protein
LAKIGEVRELTGNKSYVIVYNETLSRVHPAFFPPECKGLHMQLDQTVLDKLSEVGETLLAGPNELTCAQMADRRRAYVSELRELRNRLREAVYQEARLSAEEGSPWTRSCRNRLVLEFTAELSELARPEDETFDALITSMDRARTFVIDYEEALETMSREAEQGRT